jgi:peptidoglycan/LPS O-acetylase OafA/YrhL
VPASLERKGSIRGFWISRVFRLYPLYLLGLVVAVFLWKAGLGSIARTNYDGKTALLTHALMLSNVLGTQNAIDVLWTLSYEMAFYLLVTALFVTGKHQRSSRWALLFAVAAVGLGGLLPMTAISRTFLGTQLVAGIADLLIVAGVALAVTRYRLPKRAGAILAGGTALLLVCFNGNWVHPFEALTILALMFTGTMLYRAERGAYPWRRAVPVAVAVFVLATAAGLWRVSSLDLWSALAHQVTYRQWVTSLLGARLTFAAGLACRHKRVPAAFAWLGLVSFSVYLLHPLLIEVYKRIPFTQNPHPFPEQVLLAGAFLIVLLGCCWLSHQFRGVVHAAPGPPVRGPAGHLVRPGHAPGQIRPAYRASLRHVRPRRGAAAAPPSRRAVHGLPGVPGQHLPFPHGRGRPPVRTDRGRPGRRGHRGQRGHRRLAHRAADGLQGPGRTDRTRARWVRPPGPPDRRVLAARAGPVPGHGPAQPG